MIFDGGIMSNLTEVPGVSEGSCQNWCLNLTGKCHLDGGFQIETPIKVVHWAEVAGDSLPFFFYILHTNSSVKMAFLCQTKTPI